MKIRVRSFGSVILGALLVFVCNIRPAAAGDASQTPQGSDSPSGSEAVTQPDAALPAIPPGAPQSSKDENTLEIPPQAQVPAAERGGAVDQVNPADRKFKPGGDIASHDRNLNLGGETGQPGPLPYLGITVRYTTRCYLGKEEHGLEIVSVDPQSPAEQAGLKGRAAMTSVGAASMTATGMLGPLDSLARPLLAKAGALGHGGDLIVAVDDVRLRSQQELEGALSRLRPGDTLYITVIRPSTDDQHQTLKIPVRLGSPGAYASGAPKAATSAPTE